MNPMNPYAYYQQQYQQQQAGGSLSANQNQQQYPYYSYPNYGYYQQYSYPQQPQYYQQYSQYQQPQSHHPPHPTNAPPPDPSDNIQIPEGESRWDQSIKIYAHLYRRLQLVIPNITSKALLANPEGEQFCKSRPVYNEQSLITVRQYVERAFNKCQSDQDRNTMEGLIKQIIQDAKAKNQYLTRDWLHYPLPTLPRETSFKQQSNSSLFPPSQPPQLGGITQIGIGTTSSLGPQPYKVSSLMPSTLSDKLSSYPKQDNQTNFSKNMMTLYDVFKEKQIQTINLNHIRKKPMTFSIDQMYLESQKLQPEVQQRLQRAQQFKEEDDEDVNPERKIIGICQNIEKPYYRLTGLPDASIIRPEDVLKKALAHFINLWNEGEAEYDYIVGQLRSIRQDLTVQHIQNSFAVQVYEENARICLDIGDFPRYDSCWSMLCDLYEMVKIAEGKSDVQNGNKIEFTSYRIVYLTMLNKQDQLVKTINSLQEGIDHSVFQLALDLHDNYKCGNYSKFFQLYKTAPETMKCILNHFLARIRVRALKQFMKAFIGTLALDFIAELLAFQDKDQLRNFLQIFEQCKMDRNMNEILIKESINAFDKVNFDKLNE